MIVLGTSYRLKVTLTQGNIKVYWNGALIIDWTDPTPILSGKVGFRQCMYRIIHWDNMTVATADAGTIASCDDYDAWGCQLEGRSMNSGQSNEKYKFTGKERDVETGYDYFGARYYDARIGRWMSCDPIMEKYPSWSPYHYAANNPMRIYDPDGNG